MRQNQFVGIDQHHAVHPIDNHPFVLTHDRARLTGGNDRRQAQTTRDNRGVAVRPAGIGDEAAQRATFELQHVRWRNIMRHQNHFGIEGLRDIAHQTIAFAQGAHDARTDLHHVLFALAQVFVFKRIKLRHQLMHLFRQRPFGVVAFFDDEVLSGFDDQLIVGNHAVNRQHRTHFDRRIVV